MGVSKTPSVSASACCSWPSGESPFGAGAPGAEPTWRVFARAGPAAGTDRVPSASSTPVPHTTPMKEWHPPLPADNARIQAALTDPQRLAAVHDTGLLDSIAEESFDRLTRLASKITGAPVAFVSLLDAHRDFYKSTFGLDGPLNPMYSALI
eukprot:Opistho-1_new@47199